MKLITKKWIRVIVSLFLGGILTELLFFRNGNGQSTNLTLVFSVVFYLFLSFIVWVYYYWVFQKNLYSNTKKDDILDYFE